MTCEADAYTPSGGVHDRLLCTASGFAVRSPFDSP